MDNFLNWTDEQIEKLINDVYNGVVTREALPESLYLAIVERLTEAIVEGFGEVTDNATRTAVYSGMQKNLSVFSAAKTFQQVNDMSNFLFDADGNKNTISAFKKVADEIFGIYNGTWLETEFNTAVSLSQSASDWLDIEENADLFPLLKYSTVRDERVRASHKSLDEIIKPVNDPFWDEHYPPNDWNCRCIVEQLEEGEITDITDREIEGVPKLFKMNAGKDKIIFDEKAHPYFLVEDKYKPLKDDNFGL